VRGTEHKGRKENIVFLLPDPERFFHKKKKQFGNSAKRTFSLTRAIKMLYDAYYKKEKFN
jgi:hypothetical protein